MESEENNKIKIQKQDEIKREVEAEKKQVTEERVSKDEQEKGNVSKN